jgi:hypothetical protein
MENPRPLPRDELPDRFAGYRRRRVVIVGPQDTGQALVTHPHHPRHRCVELIADTCGLPSIPPNTVDETATRVVPWAASASSRTHVGSSPMWVVTHEGSTLLRLLPASMAGPRWC